MGLLVREVVPSTMEPCHRIAIRGLLCQLPQPSRGEKVHVIPADTNLIKNGGRIRIRESSIKELRTEVSNHEQLMNQRIGFFLTFVSIAVAGAATAASRGYYLLSVVILLSAWCATWIIAAAISRVCLKACLLMAMLIECKEAITLTIRDGFQHDSTLPWSKGQVTLVDLGIGMPRLVRIFLLILTSTVICTWLWHDVPFFRRGDTGQPMESAPCKTNCNRARNRSFCVCQAPFPNKKDSWNKIAKNLRGTIDEDAFEAFRTTVSLPFKPGERVQVKVIDARGTAIVKTVRI